MNLSMSPTIEQLRSLLASCNDLDGPHVVWVDIWDNVHISCITGDFSPAGWTEKMGDLLKFRYETLDCGNDYVGPEAARCDVWPPDLYNLLIRDYKNGATGYISG